MSTVHRSNAIHKLGRVDMRAYFIKAFCYITESLLKALLLTILRYDNRIILMNFSPNGKNYSPEWDSNLGQYSLLEFDHSATTACYV